MISLFAYVCGKVNYFQCCARTEAVFLDKIQTKSFPPCYSQLRLEIPISSNSHNLLRISSNSRNLLHISTVQLLYTVKEKGENLIENPNP
jgi:hypothetical protein